MQTNNPYYIEPAGSTVGQGLAGIGQIIGQKREERMAKEQASIAAEQEGLAQARNKQLFQALDTAYRSGDMETVQSLVMQNPELAEAVQTTMGFQDDMRDRQLGDSTGVLKQVLTTNGPDQARDILIKHINMLAEERRDYTQSMQLLEEIANPETYEEGMITAGEMYAINDAEGFKAFNEALGRGVKADSGTPMGKLNDDLRNNRITQGQYDVLSSQILSTPDAGGADQRERIIQQYQENFGLDKNSAIEAADSQPMMDQNGNLSLYNPITQTVRYMDTQNESGEQSFGRPVSVGVDDLAFDPAKGTGVVATLAGMWNASLGQLPLMPIAKDAADAAQNLLVLERDAIKALSSSSRPPVIEQQRIMGIIPDGMSFTENPQIAQQKMISFIDLMAQQYIDDKRFASNRTNPKSVRDDSTERARSIESIINRVLQPEAAKLMFDSINNLAGDVERIQNMGVDELMAIEDLGTLSDAAFEVYQQRINEIQ